MADGKPVLPDGILQLAELSLNPDVIVLATPEIAGMPYVVSGLVAAGGLAAASNVFVFQLFASAPEDVLAFVWGIAAVAFAGK